MKKKEPMVYKEIASYQSDVNELLVLVEVLKDLGYEGMANELGFKIHSFKFLIENYVELKYGGTEKKVDEK